MRCQIVATDIGIIRQPDVTPSTNLSSWEISPKDFKFSYNGDLVHSVVGFVGPWVDVTKLIFAVTDEDEKIS